MASSWLGPMRALLPPPIWRPSKGSQSRLQLQLFQFPSLPPSHSLAFPISAAKNHPVSWCPLSWEMLLLGVGPGRQPRRRHWWRTGGGAGFRLKTGNGWLADRLLGEWGGLKEEPVVWGWCGDCLHSRTGIGAPRHLGIWLHLEPNPHRFLPCGPEYCL